MDSKEKKIFGPQDVKLGYDPQVAWSIAGLLDHSKLAEVVFLDEYRPEEPDDIVA